MNINYDYYKTFYYVAKYKNLTLAANELNINQPNVSRTMKLLEENMGCKLIIRKSHGVELTDEGENLFFYVQNAMRQLQTAEEEISSYSSYSKGSISIGVSETAAYLVLLPALSEFKKKYPNIKIKLNNHNSSTAIDSVKQGLVDFAISTVYEPLEAPLISTPLMEYSDILVGGPSYKYISHDLSLTEIADYPIISLSPYSSTHKLYSSFFSQHNLSFNPQYEVETTGQLCPMLMYDLGIAFIPEIYVHSSIADGKVVRLKTKEKLPTRNICLIENNNRKSNAAAWKLKEFCLTPREYFNF